MLAAEVAELADALDKAGQVRASLLAKVVVVDRNKLLIIPFLTNNR